MFKTFKMTSCSLAIMVASTLSAHAESVDVNVIGLITPPACVPTISGGATIDYGAINPTSLNKDLYTVLEEKQLDFTIQCDSPAKVGIKAINGRPSTLAGSTEGASGAGSTPGNVYLFGQTSGTVGAVGLGMHGTQKIGGYGIRIAQDTVTADGVAVASILKNNIADTAYLSSVYGSLYTPASTRISSWAATGSLIPTAFTTLNGKLGVQAFINKTSELNTSTPVTLDGLTTIELLYL